MRRIFAVAAIIISSQSFGQDSVKIMDQVTLTASKYSVKTTQTGKVVTIISSKDIEHAGSRDLAQVITEMGGVFINGYSSNSGKEKNIYVRGASVAYTLITIDGIPVYDASGIGSYFDIRNIGIDNVERVEILKGSQSTLYGSDAIAGVVNIVTKKGAASATPSVSQVIDYGSYNTFRSGTTVNGSYKIFDYNLSFSHLSTDGISEAKQKGDIEFDKDAYAQNAMNANFGIRVSDQLRIQPFLRYTLFKGDIDLNAFADDRDFTNENKNFQTGVRNIIGLGKGQLNVLYQFTKTNRNYVDDSLDTNPVEGYYLYNHQRYRSDEHFGEAFLVYPFNALKLTTGIDVRSSHTDYNGIHKTIYDALDQAPYPDSTSNYSRDSAKQNQVGVYAALNYTWKNLSVEGGGRFNHHSEYGNNFAFNFNPSYLINNQVKVYANASSGYNVPSLYQLYSLYGNRDLKPQTSLSLEAGAQVFSANGKNSLRATWFNRKVKDVIIYDFNTATSNFSYINEDEQDDHGIELEANATIAGQLQLRANYTYATGKVTTQQNGKDSTYFNLLRRPKSTLTVFAGWQANRSLYVSAQTNLIGERKDVYFDPLTYKRVDITLDSYVLLNLYAEYALGKNVKLFADVRNVLDEDYMDIYGYSTAGLNAYGGILFKF